MCFEWVVLGLSLHHGNSLSNQRAQTMAILLSGQEGPLTVCQEVHVSGLCQSVLCETGSFGQFRFSPKAELNLDRKGGAEGSGGCATVQWHDLTYLAKVNEQAPIPPSSTASAGMQGLHRFRSRPGMCPCFQETGRVREIPFQSDRGNPKTPDTRSSRNFPD